MLGRLLLVCAVGAIAASGSTLERERLRFFQTIERIQAEGYPAETHHATTPDGYILEMHRIPYGRNGPSGNADRPVVFVMHGLLAASNSFIGIGAEHSLAYNLADAGFDVWMGNARGNTHSRFHVSLNPDDNNEKFEFFDFSFEEIGAIDLPTMIDYVLENTGNQQLHYIGHSQGGTSFLILTTMRPEYNDKIASAHLLAAVAYQDYFPNRVLAAFSDNADLIYALALRVGLVEFLPSHWFPFIREGTTDVSTTEYTEADLRRDLNDVFGARRDLGFDRDVDFMLMAPAGAALKQIAHYGQNIRDKVFRRYHYGLINNLIVYGQREPPVYDFGLISCEVTMHYSMNDNLLDERDVLAMVADMPNAKARRVARDSFEHADYIFALDSKELVNDYIVEAIQNHRN